MAWARRPQAAAFVVALADPDRGWNAVVVGEHERAFYGSQYAAMAPLFEHYGVQLWMPETGGRVDYQSEHDEKTMTVLGRQVWNRQRTDTELADPGNVTLGQKSVQLWNLLGGWVISNRPAHPALISEADFVAVQDINAARGSVPKGELVPRRYLLAGLLVCVVCGRRMESAWTNGKPAYRYRHGRTSAMAPDPARRRTPTSARTSCSRTCPPCTCC